MQKVVTHNGGFHADDVFAVAALELAFGPDALAVTRTRDDAVIAAADIVVDVGGQYDPARLRFDHHQPGAPARDNGLPYAAFGLVWKHYGEQLAGSVAAADIIERNLAIPLDASDNGVQVYEQKYPDVPVASLSGMISSWRPVWNGTEDMDALFSEAVSLARKILERAILQARADIEESQMAASLYESSADKKVIVSVVHIGASFFIDYPEVLFIVCPDENGNWDATAVRESRDSFATRVRFPESWGGLRDSGLAAVSGVADAVFCHRGGFLFVAKSQEGALAAVEKVMGGK